MRVVSAVFNDTVLNIYYLDTGEKVPRHQHPFNHLTTTVQGATEVEVFNHESWGIPWVRTVLPGDTMKSTIDLPAMFDHEIRAIQDDTIVVNTQPRQPQAPIDYAPGVIIKMADGTYVRRTD